MKYIKKYKVFESKSSDIFDYIELVFSDDVDDRFISSFDRTDDQILLFYEVKHGEYKNYDNTYKDFEKLVSETESIKDVKVGVDRIMDEYRDDIVFRFWYTEFGSLALSFKLI